MAKQVTGQAKFQVPGGQATPAPPVGTSLGKFGINLGQFVQQFNDRTKEFNGTPIPLHRDSAVFQPGLLGQESDLGREGRKELPPGGQIRVA